MREAGFFRFLSSLVYCESTAEEGISSGPDYQTITRSAREIPRRPGCLLNLDWTESDCNPDGTVLDGKLDWTGTHEPRLAGDQRFHCLVWKGCMDDTTYRGDYRYCLPGTLLHSLSLTLLSALAPRAKQFYKKERHAHPNRLSHSFPPIAGPSLFLDFLQSRQLSF